MSHGSQGTDDTYASHATRDLQGRGDRRVPTRQGRYPGP